jgi:CRISPR-associated endonuclease/helicase Cas3
MAEMFYAHSKEGCPPDRWHPLDEHLKKVAELARSFAEAFGAGEWGYLAGLWHDLGKYSQEFQKRLRSSRDGDGHIETKVGRPDHSTAGGKHAFDLFQDKGKLLAYAIAGHHAGLPDGKSNADSCLTARLKRNVDYSTCPPSILHRAAPGSIPLLLDNRRGCFQLTFFIRMIYSCLVDADFLDTEAFMDPEKSTWRSGYLSLEILNRRLTSALTRLMAHAPETSLNKRRSEILTYCLEAAEWPPGLFSLTVPTGGGKTLSSLAFGLKHALAHGLRRVIYVIPYTSIIEQNAAVFRDVLGEDAVLEHHSNYEPKGEDHRSRLASENWDAPLIVTTNIQFFESLFDSRSSRCRKIHRIAGSIVILDEAQMLPVPLLRPSLEALRELSSATYRTTIVLCTATQPALSTTESFKDGLDGVREIIPNPIQLYQAFKRVKTEQLHVVGNDELVERLKGYKQVLCIVNTRRHARLIYQRLREKVECYHLSALMCPAHRTQVLSRIRQALADDEPCRVISTQLVEAGVDIDFPVVFRSATGVDSLAQAAGRCNREGRLRGQGQFFVFFPERGLPPGYLRQAAETAESVLRHHQDPLSLDAVLEYFRTFYWLKGEKLDEHGILADLSEGARCGDFPFRIIDQKYEMIQDGMEPIIIPWNKETETIIQGLRYSDYPGALVRKAQRFTVQVPPGVLSNLEIVGSIERLHDQFCVLVNRDLYRSDVGLCPDDPTFHRVEDLIV